MGQVELTLDLKNYKEGGSVFYRKAVRGLIKRGDQYLAIHGRYGDYKFPGGGMKKGEQFIDTLIREVQEETGFHVIPESIGDCILIHEKRKGDPDDLMEMDSWYYSCDVLEQPEERNLDDYEKDYNYQVVWMTLEEMIDLNARALNDSRIPWVERELMVMKALHKNA